MINAIKIKNNLSNLKYIKQLYFSYEDLTFEQHYIFNLITVFKISFLDK